MSEIVLRHGIIRCAANDGHAATQALPKLLVVDDLPYAAGSEQRRRLGLALQDLAASARCPVIVIVTTAEGGGTGTGASFSSSARASAGGWWDGLHKVQHTHSNLKDNC